MNRWPATGCHAPQWAYEPGDRLPCCGCNAMATIATFDRWDCSCPCHTSARWLAGSTARKAST